MRGMQLHISRAESTRLARDVFTYVLRDVGRALHAEKTGLEYNGRNRNLP